MGAGEVSAWLIAVTGLIYVAVAIDLAFAGKTGLAITYAAYAAANVGLYMAAGQ
jgi:hypothetical protein